MREDFNYNAINGVIDVSLVMGQLFIRSLSI